MAIDLRGLPARIAVTALLAATPPLGIAATAAADPGRTPFECHTWDGPTLPGERCYPHERGRDRPAPRDPAPRHSPAEYFGPGWFGSS